jgi:hypothetical protein
MTQQIPIERSDKKSGGKMAIQKKSLINKHANVKKAVIAKSTVEPTTVAAKSAMFKRNLATTKSSSHLSKSSISTKKGVHFNKMAIN